MKRFETEVENKKYTRIHCELYFKRVDKINGKSYY